MLNETLFRCNSCSLEAAHDELPLTKDPFERFQPGEIYTDVECPECGALCFPAATTTRLNLEEQIIVIEVANRALADAYQFDWCVEHLDLSDDYMLALRDKLSILAAPPDEIEDDDQPEELLYEIVRFHQSGQREIIESGLSRAEAQAHCSQESSKGDTWFDGFAEEGDYTTTPATDEQTS